MNDRNDNDHANLPLHYAKAVAELKEIVRRADVGAVKPWIAQYFKTYRVTRRIGEQELIGYRLSAKELQQEQEQYVRRTVAEGVMKDIQVTWRTERDLPIRGSYCEAELIVFRPETLP